MGRSVDHSGVGDAAWFELFYADHYELILAYALRRTETREDAADVVAETFLTAWRRRDQAPDGAAVRLWLYGIARRVTANHVRGRRRYERLGVRLRADADAVADAPGAEMLADLRGPVVAAFGRLGPTDREILTLVAAEGLSPQEAAIVLGCSAATARVRLYRARLRLARELEAAGVEL